LVGKSWRDQVGRKAQPIGKNLEKISPVSEDNFDQELTLFPRHSKIAAHRMQYVLENLTSNGLGLV
jgi:hypothetical protein